ncbi:hydrogenase maturation factor HoxV/HupK [Burkholderia sp. JP2-270]|uniref:hydrogenase maturation factor HoxV/HupK n=1 Tax=Burkholderia sp. JP2-270 TaxID=2217913 RepID=UPI001EF7B92C|nr:hydrogenase maturation factor HoxV/HupK [Burkholderia sp. JP2-270]
MTGVASTKARAYGLAAWAGQYVVRPGRWPSIDGGRPPLAGLLLRGQPAALAASRLSAVFSLCGRAHALCAELAVTAAGAPAPDPAGDGARSAALARETVAEHLRRIWLEWPARLSGGAPRALPDAQAAGTREWIERHVLGAPASGWLARWEDDPRACLVAWTERTTTVPASLLMHCRAVADGLRMLPRALCIDDARLSPIGAAIACDPRFAQRPQQDGAPAETGVWTRCGDPRIAAYDTAWLRLGARVAELARLVAGGPAAFALRSGALALGPGEAVAWCEMARGVLIHWVRLAPGDATRVVDYRVVSPTEWNFHPDGSLAHALARFDTPRGGGGDAALEAAVGALMGAFDPCIAYALETNAPVRRER